MHGAFTLSFLSFGLSFFFFFFLFKFFLTVKITKFWKTVYFNLTFPASKRHSNILAYFLLFFSVHVL